MVLPRSFVIIIVFHRYYKAYNICGCNTSLVSHLESGNENLKLLWSQVTQMSDRDEEQMSQNTNTNSAVDLIVAGLTGVTGSLVIKFGYKEFPVKDQRWRAWCRNCNKRIQ